MMDYQNNFSMGQPNGVSAQPDQASGNAGMGGGMQMPPPQMSNPLQGLGGMLGGGGNWGGMPSQPPQQGMGGMYGKPMQKPMMGNPFGGMGQLGGMGQGQGNPFASILAMLQARGGQGMPMRQPAMGGMPMQTGGGSSSEQRFNEQTGTTLGGLAGGRGMGRY